MADRITAGASAKRNGKAFEKQLARIFSAYEKAGILKMVKAHEALKPVSGRIGGTYRAVFTKSGQPDFYGCFQNGRTIVIEAKHTETDKINLSALTDGEAEQLASWYAFGALCGVAVQYGDGRVYFYPWYIWTIYGRDGLPKHIKQKDSDKYLARWFSDSKIHKDLYSELI